VVVRAAARLQAAAGRLATVRATLDAVRDALPAGERDLITEAILAVIRAEARTTKAADALGGAA
jgi:hypothetical protein